MISKSIWIIATVLLETGYPDTDLGSDYPDSNSGTEDSDLVLRTEYVVLLDPVLKTEYRFCPPLFYVTNVLYE